jgi:O-antigen ligase
VYLLSSYCILYVANQFININFKKELIAVVILCALLTQSVSGFIGIAIFACMSIVNMIINGKPAKTLFFGFVLYTFVAVFWLAIPYVERFSMYYEAFGDIWHVLLSEEPVGIIAATQINNIYPIFVRIREISTLDILPALIGEGLGSSSLVNNKMPGMEEFAIFNPHSQLIRLVFESGLIGTYLYLAAFFYPMARYTNHFDKNTKQQILFATMLVLALALAQRTSLHYIYLGIMSAVYHLYGPNSHSKLESKIVR